MRLFEALGDMALMMLARRGARAHVLRRRGRRRAAARGQARPAAREAARAPGPRRRSRRLRAHRRADGRVRRDARPSAPRATCAPRTTTSPPAIAIRARAAAERAVENDPYDVDAVDLASQLAIEQSDVEAAAAMLTRLLTAKDDRFTADATRRARAAVVPARPRARAARRHPPGASPRSSARSRSRPTREGATLARRELVELVQGRRRSGARRDAIAAHLAAITARDRRARRSRRVGRRAAPPEQARRRARDARARDRRAATPPTSTRRAFLSIHKPYAMRDDEPYKAALDADDRGR